MEENPPPPSTSVPTEKASTSSRSSNRDVIHMERNRREKMTEFYTTLQSLVPNLFPRATRTRIIDETIAYIKGLEEVIIALDAQKAAREASTGPPVSLRTPSNSVVEITMAGNTAFFRMCLPSRPGLMTRVLERFEEHEAEVLMATAACNDGSMITITVSATVLGEEAVGRIREDLMILLP